MDLTPSKVSELRIVVENGDSDGDLGAGVRRKRRLAPWKHLKCDYASSVCARCQKSGEKCIRTADRVKFRHGSSAKYDSKGFAASQVWVRPNKSSGRWFSKQPQQPSANLVFELKYIDETAEIAAIYGQSEEDSDIDHESQRERRQRQDQQQDQQHEQRNGQMQEEGGSAQSQSDIADASQLDPDFTPTYTADDLPEEFQNPSTALFSTADANSSPSDCLRYSSQLCDTSWKQRFQTEQSTADQSDRLRGFSGSQTSVPFPSPTQSRSVRDTSTRSSFSSGLVKIPPSAVSQTASSELEVTLLRYFIDVLACWFDICDPEKHFALIVPHRARWCPPLKTALLASSARHMTRVCNPMSKPGFVYVHDGEVLPDLTEETALHYHSECIKDLVQRSMNMEQTQDASLLAAAIILRFYEEIDAPLREDPGDNELFLRVINVFIDAQIPSAPVVPHSSPVITGPEIATNPYGSLLFSPQITSSPNAPSQISSRNEFPSHWRTDGLRQAGFWVAFRQEVHSAFLKQRPFNLSLARCEAFRSFSPAEDAVWADRLVVFCADVLDFCYNDNKDQASQQKPVESTKDRWLTLKRYEKTWREVLPASFEPIYYRDPNRFKGEVFPQICYMVDCHVVGVQYVELAKILLSVYDPTRPKLGPGYIASMRSLSSEVQAAVLRLCGIATSNRKCPPALVTAFLAIAMCGEYFQDPLEQEALLGLLDEMETNGWPAGDTRQTLKEAWHRASE
ncbi:hypothetical protein LTS17_001920 [Exophiala oligosperma]